MPIPKYKEEDFDQDGNLSTDYPKVLGLKGSTEYVHSKFSKEEQIFKDIHKGVGNKLEKQTIEYEKLNDRLNKVREGQANLRFDSKVIVFGIGILIAMELVTLGHYLVKRIFKGGKKSLSNLEKDSTASDLEND